MASSDARPIPKKGVAYRVTFGILDADGDLVTAAAGLDSEVSKDGATFADCTNEATEIATASGMYYLDLTASEMDADTVAIIIKTSTSGAKTTPIVLYPEEAGDIRVDVTMISGDATSADNLESYTDGTTPMPVNATQISGDATAADNAEAFFDGTGYAGTNNVIPTVTSVTNTVNANVTQISGDSVAADNLESYTDGTTPMPVNVTQVSGDATAADNAEAFFDGTGYAGTGNTIPTVTNVTNGVTVTTNNDKTGYRLSATGVDDIWDEARSGHTTDGTFGQEAQPMRSGTAQAGAAGTITLDASASASDDFYNNTIIQIVSGTGSGQSRIISDYVGSTKVATVNGNWITNPSTDSVFVIRPFGSIPGATAPTAGEVADAVWDEARSGHTTGGTFGEYVNADVTRISGDSTAADNLEAAADGTGYNLGGGSVVAASVTGAVGSVTASVTVGSMAANTLTASALAADAVTEIQSGLATSAALATVQADTDDIQTRLPAALVGGRIDANVGAISSDATAADNAEAFFDGTGYAGTNNVIPTVTTVTNTVSANAIQISGDSTAADNLEAALDGTGGVTISAAVTGNITGNLSGSVGSVTGNVGGNVVGSVASVTASVTVGTNNDKTGYRLSATGVDDILDEVVEGSYTFRQFLRLYAAALAGKLSGAATTTVTIRDVGDTKARITATVDADGNRTAVTLDAT